MFASFSTKLSYTSHFLLLPNYSHFVSSYHEKIYLHFYYVIRTLTSYHCIIVSRKNISSPGPFPTPRNSYYYLTTLTSYHRIKKKYIFPRILSYTSQFLLLPNYSHFVSSYHEKIYLHFYYVIRTLTSYHRIIVSRKNISSPGFFHTPRNSYYYLITLTSYHRITKKYIFISIT